MQNTKFLPVFRYTLRCLVPRCCGVSLQAGLYGKNIIHFLSWNMQKTFVPEPDPMAIGCNGKPGA